MTKLDLTTMKERARKGCGSHSDIPVLIAEVERLRSALKFYATYSPRYHPDGFYEIHVAPGEGGEVKFGTFARQALGGDGKD